MKSILVILITGTINVWAQTNPIVANDLFPFGKGLRFNYSYSSEKGHYSFPGWVNEVTDSGMVIYQVKDSSKINDTMCVWTVNENQHLLNRHYNGHFPFSPDTLYWLDTSKTILVYEELTGMHKLHCNSLVWSFPIHDTLVLNSGVDTSTEIYRYTINNGYYIAYYLKNETYSIWRIDSIYFQTGMGLISRDMNLSSNFSDHDFDFLHISLLSVSTSVLTPMQNKPILFRLDQNYPNPFNPTTTIHYEISQKCFIILKVIDVIGREIETLVIKEQSAGSYSTIWNADGLPSGVYFVCLQAGSSVDTKKLLLLK